MANDISRDSDAGTFLRAGLRRSRNQVDPYTGRIGNPGRVLHAREVWNTCGWGEWKKTTDYDKLASILAELDAAALIYNIGQTSGGWDFRIAPAGTEVVERWLAP
jgi:hypothetical protein